MSNWVQSCAVLLVLFVATAKLTYGQAQDAQSAIIKSAHKAGALIAPIVVRVETEYAGTTEEHKTIKRHRRGTGAGFFVDERGDIATAAHVVCHGNAGKECMEDLATVTLAQTGEHIRKSGGLDLSVYIRYRKSPGVYSERIPATILAVDDKEDVAILQPQAKLPAARQTNHINIYGVEVELPALDSEGVESDRFVSVDGFPLGTERLFTIYGKIIQTADTAPTGQLDFLIAIGPKKIIEGYSGAPVTDVMSAKIIGVQSMIIQTEGEIGSNLAAAIPIRYIRALLK